MEAFIKPFAEKDFWLQSTPGPKSQKSYKMQNLVLETFNLGSEWDENNILMKVSRTFLKLFV
jgi:hypothetical protein